MKTSTPVLTTYWVLCLGREWLMGSLNPTGLDPHNQGLSYCTSEAKNIPLRLSRPSASWVGKRVHGLPLAFLALGGSTPGSGQGSVLRSNWVCEASLRSLILHEAGVGKRRPNQSLLKEVNPEVGGIRRD